MTRGSTGNALVAAAFMPRVVFGQSVPGLQPVNELSGVVISLAVVVAVIVVGAWAVRRSPLGAVARKVGPLKVIATLPLGPKERLVLVEAAGRELLVGVSPAGIFALRQTEAAEIPPAATASSVAAIPGERSFRQTIDLQHSGQLQSQPP